MKWSSHLSKPAGQSDSLEPVLAECCRQVKRDLGGVEPDLSICFVSPHFAADYAAVPSIVARELGAGVFVGCSAGGLIGGGQEVEQQPAVSVTAAHLPGVTIKSFQVESDDLPDLDDPPGSWEKLVDTKQSKQPCFIILPDPFTLRVDTLVQGLDYAFPNANKLGGLASGASRPGQNVLFHQDKVLKSGAVGVSMCGNLVMDTVVAQGCRPIGVPLRVTRCEKNFLVELDGQPAVSVLYDLLVTLSPQDQELARNSLFLGVVMDEFKDNFKSGDFLIRNLLGVEPQSGALVVGEILRPERTVQFHLRDAATSDEDLRLLLKRYRDGHTGRPAGAMIFSCLGRGQYLYEEPNHDSDCFREYMGEIPLGGFFCNGEIGPVGGTTFLHGYTSSFGIFREKEHAVK